MLKILILKLRRAWAALQHDHMTVLKLSRYLKRELEHNMAIQLQALTDAINAAAAKLAADAANVAQAQNDLAAALANDATLQAQIDALTATLTQAAQ